jgi:hypothetical protein
MDFGISCKKLIESKFGSRQFLTEVDVLTIDEIVQRFKSAASQQVNARPSGGLISVGCTYRKSENAFRIITHV